MCPSARSRHGARDVFIARSAGLFGFLGKALDERESGPSGVGYGCPREVHDAQVGPIELKGDVVAVDATGDCACRPTAKRVPKTELAKQLALEERRFVAVQVSPTRHDSESTALNHSGQRCGQRNARPRRARRLPAGTATPEPLSQTLGEGPWSATRTAAG